MWEKKLVIGVESKSEEKIMIMVFFGRYYSYRYEHLGKRVFMKMHGFLKEGLLLNT